MKKNVESPFSPSPSVVPPSPMPLPVPSVPTDAKMPVFHSRSTATFHSQGADDATVVGVDPLPAPIDRAALAAKLDGMEIAIGGTVSAAAAKIIGEVSAALKAVVES